MRGKKGKRISFRRIRTKRSAKQAIYSVEALVFDFFALAHFFGESGIE